MSTPDASTRSKVRVGILGTSWWADSMYLPALAAHPDVEIVGLCGRTPSKAQAFNRYNKAVSSPHTYAPAPSITL